MNLEQHYQSMWNSSLEKFREHKFQYDDKIASLDDKRYGITLLARPCPQVKHNILQTLDEIEAVAPHQYYYPQSDLHLTILSLISCYPGFTTNEIDPKKYRDLIQFSVQNIQPFHIKFSGLTASPSCILIRGFPDNNALTSLRNSLRGKFQHSDLQHSIDKRYKLQTAHLTAIRFKEPILNTGAFIEKIKTKKDQYFGQCFIEELELVGNDWYQRAASTQHIHTFKLRG